MEITFLLVILGVMLVATVILIAVLIWFIVKLFFRLNDEYTKKLSTTPGGEETQEHSQGGTPGNIKIIFAILRTVEAFYGINTRTPGGEETEEDTQAGTPGSVAYTKLLNRVQKILEKIHERYK